MKRWMMWLALAVWLAVPAAASAGGGNPPLAADPAELNLTGRQGGSFGLTLRLVNGEQKLEGIQVFSTDLVDASGDGRARDPLASSSVTFLPGGEIAAIEAGESARLVVQVASPGTAGTYAGTLTVRWKKPAAGEIKIPLKVTARTTPALALEYPDKVVLFGTNDTSTPDSRQVTLRETVGGTPLTGLKAVPQYLQTAGGRKSIGAERVQVSLPAGPLQGGELLAARVSVNTLGAEAGAYSGTVLLQYDYSQQLKLPVEVNVRDPAGRALAWLIGSALLGLLIAGYREAGKPRDELLRRMGRVFSALQNDPDLQQHFGAELNRLLAKAQREIDEKKLTEATASVIEAEGILNKWLGSRSNWMEQLACLQGFRKRLGDGDVGVYLQDLRRAADDLLREAHKQADPWALRDETLKLEKKLAEYRRLEETLDKTGEMRINAPAAIPAEDRETWRRKEIELKDRLERLGLEDEAGRQKLDVEIQALFVEVSTHINQVKGGRSVPAALPRAVVHPPPEPGAAGGAAAFKGRDWAAAVRLSIYTLVIYAVGGALLIALGYTTLYVKDPVFGDDGILDYLNLVAWGFGGQSSFSAVGDLLRGWGIHFGKSGG